MLVARASPAPKIPCRERERVYELDREKKKLEMTETVTTTALIRHFGPVFDQN
jgi:hypothetical protein